MSERHVFSETLLQVMNEPLTPEEKKRHSIWIKQKDIRFRARYDDLYGVGARIAARYETYVGFKDPRQVTFHMSDECLVGDDVLYDIKIECIEAVQRSIEEYMVGGMIQGAREREAYIPYRDFYVPHKPGYYRFRANYFPSPSIKNDEVLVLMSQEMYHRMMFNRPPKEIPEALIGKIEWVEGYL